MRTHKNSESVILCITHKLAKLCIWVKTRVAERLSLCGCCGPCALTNGSKHVRCWCTGASAGRETCALLVERVRQGAGASVLQIRRNGTGQLRANDVIQNYRARAEHAVRDIVVPHHIYRTDMRMRISHTDDDSCRCHMCIITRFIVNKTALWRRVRGPVGAYAASRVGPWGHKPPHMHEPRRARLW